MKLFSQRKFINTMLLIALLILSWSGFLAYHQIQRLINSNQWVIHTYNVMVASNKTLLALNDAESDLTTYLATNTKHTVDAKVVQKINRALNQAQENMFLVQGLTKDNGIQQQRLNELLPLINNKIALTQQILAAHTNQTPTAAMLTKQAELKASITQAMNLLKMEELKLLQSRNAAFAFNIRQADNMLYLSVGLSELLFLFSFILINHHLNQRNISERKQLASEAYKSAILETASDSIITLNQQNRIVSCNVRTAKIFGWSMEDLLNNTIDLLIPELSKTMTAQAGKTTIECQAINKNGDLFPVELAVSKMNLNDEQMLVLIIRDITERKQTERMKNEFISVVSHELRTPLTSIRGSVGLIKSGTVGEFPDKAKKLLDIASNNCDRLLMLINDILDIEKIEGGNARFQLKIVDVDLIAKEAITANKQFAEKYGVTLHFMGPKESSTLIYADPDRIMQVLTNLISNAVKFSPRGGRVTIETTTQNDLARVSVSDQGSGIADEFQARIFQKFSQADASPTRDKGGTGLGLSICKAIVEQHGGKINFSSTPGKGATFYFEIPLWHEQKSVRADKHVGLGVNKNLLICDDDEDQAKYLGALLTSVGFHSDLCYTVADAKKYLAKNNYQALLLDLILPDQDGISFIRELRSTAETRTLPIIVVSMIAKTGKTLLNGEAFSVLDWLDKPVDLSRLLNVISHLKSTSAKKMPHILHVEDDIDTQHLVSALLENYATVTGTSTMQETQAILNKEMFDLVILDLILPDGNGAQLLPIFAKYKLPIIVYSAIELDDAYSSYVSEELTKSKTSNEQLLSTIMNVVKEGA